MTVKKASTATRDLVCADSGASNVLRPPEAGDDESRTNPIELNLAMGPSRKADVDSDEEIVDEEVTEKLCPLGRYIDIGDIDLIWNRRHQILRRPGGKEYRLHIVNFVPYLTEQDFQELRDYINRTRRKLAAAKTV